MKKYLLMPVIFGILSFVKLEAAPMDAYYCFSTTEDAVVVEKMDRDTEVRTRVGQDRK